MSTQPVYSQNKEDKPLVSFIVTYYSEPADMLKECISSILALSLNETERQIIVVDDGADYSPINELLALSSNIVYVRQPNRGLGQARNTGIELAEGSFIQFVDGDDLLLTSAYVGGGCCAYRDLTEDLPRVCREDTATEVLREANTKRRLAYPCGANKHDKCREILLLSRGSLHQRCRSLRGRYPLHRRIRRRRVRHPMAHP